MPDSKTSISNTYIFSNPAKFQFVSGEAMKFLTVLNRHALSSIFFVLVILLNQPSVNAQAKDRPIADKWALVIGIDRFKDKRIPTLKYSAKDAKDFADFLVNKANFAKDHVLLLSNEEATFENIEAALGDNWLPKRVMQDDLVLIFISTHGSPKELDVGNDNWLIAHNTNIDRLFSTGIELARLAETVKRRTRCQRIVLLLDACNSGAAETGGGKGLIRTQNFDIASLVGDGQIVISSSDANQRSWESKRYKNGVFTRNLIKTLDNSSADTPLESVFSKVKDNVAQEVQFDRKVQQTPVLKSKWKGKKLALLAPPAKPRNVSSSKTKPALTATPPADTSGLSKEVEKQLAQKNFGEAMRLAKQGADSGDLECIKLIGNMYIKGEGVSKDTLQASQWWQRAADKNYAPALHNLGLLYFQGNGVKRDISKAVIYWSKASEQNFGKSMVMLAGFYQNGIGVPKDNQKALMLIKKAADQGDPDGINEMGICYQNGLGVPKSYEKAREYFKKAADKNNPIAQFNLGVLYFKGLGVNKDDAEALRWFQKSANQNYPKGINGLANCFYHGRGTALDYKEAVRLYKKAADLNHSMAQYNLAYAYFSGRGVPVDLKQAVHYFELAANSNCVEALLQLGYMYEEGKGVPKNFEKAKEYYERGAKLGDSLCQNQLGNLYFLGNGVKRNYKVAAQLYLKSAQSNCAAAQNNIGYCYMKGKGVNKDKETALTYFRLSAQQGYKMAKENLERYGP